MTAAPASIFSRTARLAWLSGTTILALVLDQASKIYAMKYLREAPAQSYFSDIFRIEYAENHGAFLSLLSNMPEEVRFWILTVINGIVLIGLAVYLLTTRVITLSTFVPLMLVVAGGIGNLIDRIRFGYVVDFLNLGIGDLRTGIFNIADMFITAGFLVMAITLIRGEAEPSDAEKTAPAAEAAESLPASRQGQI